MIKMAIDVKCQNYYRKLGRLLLLSFWEEKKRDIDLENNLTSTSWWKDEKMGAIYKKKITKRTRAMPGIEGLREKGLC